MGLHRILVLVVFAGLPTLLSGCSICCSPYLEDYAAYGSRVPRMDMKNGRVGSVFSDPQWMGRDVASPPMEVQVEGSVSQGISYSQEESTEIVYGDADELSIR